MKILHLPTPVGGNAIGLSNAERKIGLDSKTFYVFSNKFNYPSDFSIANDRKFIKLFKILFFIIFKINQFDVLHFNFGSTLINYPKLGIHNIDLFLYKNRRIFVTYNGDDARLQYNHPIGWELLALEDKISIHKNELTTKTLQRRVNGFSKIAEHHFALNPDLIKYLPSNTTFLPYTISNWEEITYCPPNLNNPKTIIVHAPTNRLIKGSNVIIPILEKLKESYPDKFDYILVEGMTSEQAREEYLKADLIIDQLIVGWYGAFAAEAMKMGKPVMVYIHMEDLVHIPSEMADDLLDSIINVNFYNLHDKLIEIIQDKTMLKYYSDNGLEYVNKWHHPRYVAQIVKGYYNVKS